MVAHYTVVRYMPDPVSEECVNVGVIAWDRAETVCRFLKNWRRVSAFGGESVAYLKQFADEMEALTSSQLLLFRVGAKTSLDGKDLEAMVGTWHGSIQFSKPRGSLKGAQALLEDVAPIFLRERSSSEHHRSRSRSTVAKMAAGCLFREIENLNIPEPAHFVRRDYVLKGKVAEHRFDVGLVNGKVYNLIQAVSFEKAESDLRQELYAKYFDIEDVRRDHSNLGLAIVAFPPIAQPQIKLFEEATKILGEFGAQIVIDRQLDSWAKGEVKAFSEAKTASH